MHRFTLFHRAERSCEYLLFPPSRNIITFLHVDSKHCVQYEQVSTKFTLRLRDVVAAPGIKPCTKNSFRFLLQVLGNGDNREICIRPFIKSSLSHNSKPIVYRNHCHLYHTMLCQTNQTSSQTENWSSPSYSNIGRASPRPPGW